MGLPSWIFKVLLIATIYYLLLAISGVFLPGSWAFLAGLPDLGNDVAIQALGAAMGAMAVASLLALLRPETSQGLLWVLFWANVLDLVVLGHATYAGYIFYLSGLLFICFDIAWAVLFYLVLRRVKATYAESSELLPRADLEDALSMRPQNTDMTLGELSEANALLVVLLRHSGCTFCRAHLSALANERSKLIRAGTRLVVVMMSPHEEIAQTVEKYYGQDALLVSDPGQVIYKAFGTKRGSLKELLGIKEFIRAVFSGWIFKYGLGWPGGDVAQLGGTFILKNRRIEFARPANSASEICPLPEMEPA